MVRIVRLALLLSLIGAVLAPASAQTGISLDEVRQAGLRVVEITTEGGEEPRGEEIAKPGDPYNVNIVSANKVGCRIVITLLADTLYDSGPHAKDSSGATIRINGNTSAFYSDPLNMPYKLKLEKKADLLARGDEEHYEDKNWRLLKDATSLNTIAALELSRLAGMEYTPAYTPCNVVINGDYRGCYLLMETVRRNPRCRIACDKQAGFIVERDPYWWKEQQWFASGWYDGSSMYRWTWKYPDAEEVTEQQQQAVQLYINAAEKSLDDGSYDRYFDTASLARWLLVHDILGTRDSGGANMYFKKQDDSDTTLLEMPCVWDFDSSYDMAPGSFSRLHTSSNAYFSVLLKSTNRTFARTYVALWNELKDSLAGSLAAFVSHYPDTDEGTALDASRKLYNRRWGTTYTTVRNNALSTLDWLQSHIDPLDRQIQLIDVADSGLVTAVSSGDSQNGGRPTYYNINGVRVSSSARPAIAICRQGNAVKIVLRHEAHAGGAQ